MLHQEQVDGRHENEELLTSSQIRTRSLWLAPPQWLAGIIGYAVWPLFMRLTVIVPPLGVPQPFPTELIDEIHDKLKPDGGFYLPSILKDLSVNPASLDRLRRLKYISYSGAPVEQWVGDLLCDHVNMVPILGSTEAGAIILRRNRDPKDWNWYQIDSRNGVQFELQGQGNGLFELISARDPALRRYQAIFIHRPHLDRFPHGDLYSKHPTKDGLYRYEGRKDDMFKLSWLAKVKAKDIESILNRHPTIQNVMVGGDGKPEPFVLVELKDPTVSPIHRAKATEVIWSLLQEINKTNVTEIQVPERLILLSDPARPLQRLTKGTLDRRSILQSYHADIESLYASA